MCQEEVENELNPIIEVLTKGNEIVIKRKFGLRRRMQHLRLKINDLSTRVKSRSDALRQN